MKGVSIQGPICCMELNFQKLYVLPKNAKFEGIEVKIHYDHQFISHLIENESKEIEVMIHNDHQTISHLIENE